MAVVAGLWPGAAGIHAQQAVPVRQSGAARAAQSESPLAQAIRAEADRQYDAAIERLYSLILEQPGTPDAVAARLRLARLLALGGDWAAAILECQQVRGELPADSPERQQALDMATAIGRRLRAAGTSENGYFPTFEPLPIGGMAALDDPRAIVFAADGRFALLDEGAGRIIAAASDTATVVPGPQDPTAVTMLGDGTILAFGKGGLVAVQTPRTIPLAGTWGGKTRALKKVRSMAALAGGDLLVIDKDYDGLLRCQYPAGTCVPAGPAGRQRVVRTGASDWAYVLDDRGDTVRVLDANQREIGVIGPGLGAAKLGRVEDIAVDGVYGLYLLDRDARRVLVVTLRAGTDGRVSGVLAGTFQIPAEGDHALKNASAIGAAPGGSVVLAGRSAARLMRLR